MYVCFLQGKSNPNAHMLQQQQHHHSHHHGHHRRGGGDMSHIPSAALLGGATLGKSPHYLRLFSFAKCRKRICYNRLYFCAHIFCPKWKMFTFFLSSLPRFDKCHETSRIFPRTEQTFASARSFGVIFTRK